MKLVHYSANASEKLRLHPFKSFPGVKVDPSDEWDGVLNRVERRRRQNRINQRIYRLRRRRPVSPAEDKKSESSTTPLSASELQETLLERFTNAAHWNYTHGCPAADQLSTLTRVNVYRAYLHNIALIGLSPNGLCEAEILSPFNGMRPWTSTKTSLPPALQPTETQVFQAHHPWLDFFPHPKARDNLIREQDNYDEDELCLDILGFWNNNVPENMLLVWGEPSIPGNWEVTELFIEKWGWVIHGCPELLQSTNEWRARRGEKPILRYI